MDAGTQGQVIDRRAAASAQLLRARQCEAMGRHEDAVVACRTALSIDATLRPARQALVTLLARLDRLDEAQALFDEGFRFAPGTPAYDWLQRVLTTALERRDFALAGGYARLVAGLRWGPPVPAAVAATPTPSLPVTAAKLRHDADQLDYLAQRQLLAPEHRDLAAACRKIAQGIDRHGPGARVPLDSDELRVLWPTYNRLLHLYPAPRVRQALSGAWSRRAAQSEYLRGRLGVVVVDDFLTPQALAELRRFCLESTVWFANRYGHGRLGAFFQDGFNCPLLLQIAEDREALPDVIGDRYPLRQIWGFKNSPSLPADSTTHADFAAVNVNFWITPDEANLKPGTGGMVIFDVDAPLQWDFDTYNGDAGAIRRFLAEQRARHMVIPYRQNRAIIFHSDLFHGTSEVCFRPEYEYRRINVTLLYGDREREMDHPITSRPDTAAGGAGAAWRSRAFTRFRR